MSAQTVKHKAKDSVFTDLFSKPKYLLQLYRALHPEDRDVTEKSIKNVTIKNILLNQGYNDLGFQVGDRLVVLVEAQSTWTVNIIVRGLLYLTRSYQDYLKRTGQNLHGSRRVELPRPEIYVIYTGERKSRPEKLLLSQEFFGGEEGAVEVRVQMIYDGEEGDIISQYVSFTKVLKEQVRRWGRTKEAVKETIRICKDQEILEEYLAEREEEVISIMADLFDDDETIFNMFVESEKRQAAKKAEKRAERRTQRRMERQAAAKDRRTAQRMYGLGTSVDNIAMVLDVPVKIVEKWLGLAVK